MSTLSNGPNINEAQAAATPVSNEQAMPSDESQIDLIEQFVETNPAYYAKQFKKIGAKTGFSLFVMLEVFAYIQIARGWFGDLGAEALDRVAQIEGTLAFRKQQLASAIEKQADNIAVFERAIASLETAIGDIQAEAVAAQAAGSSIALAGLAMLVVVKLVEGVLANPVLEKRYFTWLSDKSIPSGLSSMRTIASAGFVLLTIMVSVAHYAFAGKFATLASFPTTDNIRLNAIDWVEALFDWIIEKGDWLFTIITLGIRWVLDNLELVFVGTPWIVVASFIILLTALSAGKRAAIFAAAFLGYMGLLGFWEKAMTTLALLGTAAVLSIVIGIPLGLYCARRPRVYSFIRPIMDFMQTMPAFVFMIPVIAFFGTGKPAAVVTTMIFGGTPVVRLTVLGLRGVPESIREAAIAYGASKWYLLRKVDLPLAAPSILAGINQTIMLSLAMVVVASLIGAKGLGEDVLEALQYASVGQGILAGFAILFCAMILDRIVQGRRK